MEHTEAKQAMKELTMMLIYLSRYCEQEEFAESECVYAWKSYDPHVLNELNDEDLIRQGSRNRQGACQVTAQKVRYRRLEVKSYFIAAE